MILVGHKESRLLFIYPCIRTLFVGVCVCDWWLDSLPQLWLFWCLLFLFPFFLGRDEFLVYFPFDTLSLINLSTYLHLPPITVTSSQCSPTVTTAESKPSARAFMSTHTFNSIILCPLSDKRKYYEWKMFFPIALLLKLQKIVSIMFIHKNMKDAV